MTVISTPTQSEDYTAVPFVTNMNVTFAYLTILNEQYDLYFINNTYI